MSAPIEEIPVDPNGKCRCGHYGDEHFPDCEPCSECSCLDYDVRLGDHVWRRPPSVVEWNAAIEAAAKVVEESLELWRAGSPEATWQDTAARIRSLKRGTPSPPRVDREKP
jgi:hypothetical protein